MQYKTGTQRNLRKIDDRPLDDAYAIPREIAKILDQKACAADDRATS